MLGYLLAFAYLALRGLGRLTQIELWAEDGATMLRDSLTHGWPSVFSPTDATPQVFQRLVAQLGFTFLPVHYYPHFVAFSALAVNALVLGHFARPQFRWLVSNDGMRLLTVLALCSIPGLTEMLANLANTNWFLFFGCCLVFLKDPKENLSRLDLFFLSVSLVSIGTGLLLLPLWTWRTFPRRKSFHRTDAIAGLLILSHIVLLRYLKSDLMFEIPSDPFLVWLKTYWRVILESFFLQPWFGDSFTVFLFAPGHRLLNSLLSGGPILFFLFLAWPNRKEPRAQGAFVLFLLVSLWPVLCWIGRPGSIVTFKTDTPSQWYFSHRYSFPTAFMAIIVWSVLLQHVRFSSRSSKLFAQSLFSALVIFHSYPRWRIPAYGSENRWSTASPLLAKALAEGCPNRVEIPVYPERLDFAYKAPATEIMKPCL